MAGSSLAYAAPYDRTPKWRWPNYVAILPLIATWLLGPLVAHSADCRVQLVGGVPTMVIDGRPHSGFCYSTYDVSAGNLERRVEQFAEAGCGIFNFVVEISGYGYSRPLWPAKDRWDFSDLDTRAHRILAAAPQAQLLPRIYIDAPAWWCLEHPQELLVLDDGSTSFGSTPFALPRPGNYPSLASAKWREDMQQALRTIIDHIAQSDYADHVIGYQLSGQKTEEWYHWTMNCQRLGDYSLPMQQAFRAWLAAKYGTSQALQAAWNQPAVSLETAQIPSYAERIGNRQRTFRDLSTERPVIDFHTFWSDVMADTIDLFAQTVKESTGGTKIVGAFYAYTFEFAELGEDAGHLALGRLLRSPHIDFLMAPSSYFDRNLPGKPYFRAPVQSLVLHGKMCWNDFDQVSFKYYDKLKADPNLKTWEYQMGLTRTPEEFVWMNRREIGMTLANGVQTAHFDIHGGYYEDPLILEGVKRLGEIRDASLSEDRTSSAEILVLVDERSPHYVRFRNPAETPGSFLTNLLHAQIAQLGFVAPYDTALLSDLGMLDATRYKLVLVLNAFCLDATQRRLIQQHLQARDKTIVWFYAPGFFDEANGSVEAIEQVTGIRVVADPAAGSDTSVVWTTPAAGSVDRQALLSADPLIVVDSRAIPLAVRSDDPAKVVVARRRMDAWTSIYSATAPIPAVLLKQLAADAGVHIYDHDPSHLVFANRRFLTVAANEQGGTATVRLPRQARVIDLFSQETVGLDVDQFTIPLQPKEVRMFSLQ